MRKRTFPIESGFTLLEVLVALTLMAVGAAVVMSLLSGSLGNIRKVQVRTKIMDQAQSILEKSLIDDSLVTATTALPFSLNGSFDDGAQWTLNVEEPDASVYTDREIPSNMPLKMLQYTVQIENTNSQSKTYTLQTLKAISASTTTTTSQ
jgi:prepilin-type N-terminal cleavage/methylation domain-containing protein